MLVKCSLLAAVVGAVLAFPHLFRRVDEEVRRRIEAKLAAQYPELKVSVRSALLVQGRGIEIREVTIAEPGAEGPQAELLRIDAIFLACETDWETLLRGQADIREVLLRGPKVRMTRRPDGAWSTAKLFPLPAAPQTPPPIRIEDGEIEIVDPMKNPAGALAFRNVTLSIAPATPEEADGKLGVRKFEGTLGGDLLRHVVVAGLYDPARMVASVQGTVERLELSPEFCDALPCELAARAAPLRSLRGDLNVQFRAAYDPAAPRPATFEITGQLSGGRLEDRRLPLPLSEIRASLRCNESGLAVEKLVARSGQATVRLDYRQQGLVPGGPCLLEGDVAGLAIDQDLADALPAGLQTQWQKFLPSGVVNAHLRLENDGTRWKPEVSVECIRASFTYRGFPYRLERAGGNLSLKDDVLRASLIGYSGDQAVRVSAEIFDPLGTWYGKIDARAESLPLDEKLLNALPPSARKTVQSLEPTGTLQVAARVWRERPQEPVHRWVWAALSRGSIRYQRFPYPIGDIRGTIEMTDDHWNFRDFEGTNDTGRIKCAGHLIPTSEGPDLRLWLDGADVPLEEELRDALQMNMQQVWNDLRPQGTVDLKAEIHFAAAQSKLEVELRVWPRGENTAIQPVCFPYRMDRLRGSLFYRNGMLTIEQFKAEHAGSSFSTGGHCQFLPDGSWQLALEGLTVDRLRMDRELVQALPQRLRRGVASLCPEGPLNVCGNLTFARAAADAPLTSQWDLRFDFHQGALDCGLRLENLEGAARVVGAFDGQRFVSRGELFIDSVTYRDFQFTRVNGPFWIDDDRVLLGTWVDRPLDTRQASANPPRPISGQLFGGTTALDGWILLADSRFNLHATYAGGDFARLAQEAMPGRQNLKGELAADIELRGHGRTLNELGGRGVIQLRNADVYELPLMVSLLKILSVREPNRSAFSDANIDFRIDANHVYFDNLRFSGDAVSLVGRGEMNFQSEIRLKLHAVVGRAEQNFPVLEKVMGGASRQIMQIHVGGTLQNPETSREAFPGVNNAIQSLQAERNEPARRLPPR